LGSDRKMHVRNSFFRNFSMSSPPSTPFPINFDILYFFYLHVKGFVIYASELLLEFLTSLWLIIAAVYYHSVLLGSLFWRMQIHASCMRTWTVIFGTSKGNSDIILINMRINNPVTWNRWKQRSLSSSSSSSSSSSNWHYNPLWFWASSTWRLRDHTQGHTTGGMTPLDEWSGRRRDLYLTTHNTYKRQTSMPSAGFELATSTTDQPQAYALDRSPSQTSTFRNLEVPNGIVVMPFRDSYFRFIVVQ
jgi:hypothetical protein